MIANIASPRMMLVGGGTVRQIAEVLAKFGLSRPLVVTDPFMVSSGLVQRCLEPLAEAGISAAVFSDTIPEPTDTIVENGLTAIRTGDYDCLIGFGGGSPIDTAKAMAILALGGGKMKDYKVPFQADRGAMPVIAIPTTASIPAACRWSISSWVVMPPAAVTRRVVACFTAKMASMFVPPINPSVSTLV